MITECFLCGRYTNTEVHHIFLSANRNKSERYNLTVNLCVSCHRTGKNAVHQNKDTMLMLHQYGQNKFMSEQGKTVEEFIEIFGKNYL